MVGYVIGLSTMSVGGRYFAMFLMANGYAGKPNHLFFLHQELILCSLGFALTLVWTANAIPRPPAKRSAAIGIVNGFGNLGNLCARSVFCTKSDLQLTPLEIASDRTPGRRSGARTTIPR